MDVLELQLERYPHWIPRPFARLHTSESTALTKTDPGRFHCPLPKIFGGSVVVHRGPITIRNAVSNGCHSAISTACMSTGIGVVGVLESCGVAPSRLSTSATASADRTLLHWPGTFCTAGQPHALQGRLGTVQYGTAGRSVVKKLQSRVIGSLRGIAVQDV